MPRITLNPELRVPTKQPRGGRKHSEETRNKMRKKKAPEHAAKIAAANRAKSPEIHEKGAAKRRGRKQSPEHIAKNRATRLGIKQSPETIAKRVAKNRGKKRTPEQLTRMSAAQLALGKKLPLDHPLRNINIGKKHSVEHRAKVGAASRGRIQSQAQRVKISAARIGIIFTPEHCAKIKIARAKQAPLSLEGRAKLSNSHRKRFPIGTRKGDLDPRLHIATAEVVAWRKLIYERDNFTCQHCQQYNGYLEAHHIKPWAAFPLLRFELDNGITLCKPCHSAEHKRMRAVLKKAA